MKKLRHNVYIVNNQSEFRKAIKTYWFNGKPADPNKFKELKEDMEGYPTKYPSLVVMNLLYKGINYLSNDCIPLSETQED